MFRDALVLMSFGAVSYLWLCAIASPLVSSVRSLLILRGDRQAWTALALAAAGAVLWTVAPAGAFMLLRMLETEAGVAVLRSDLLWRGVTLGNIVWLGQFLTFARIPRIGSAFETATALGLVAFVRNDPWTLSKVERLYRTHALACVSAERIVSAKRIVSAQRVVSGGVRAVAA
jgi:hypothetical protein